MASIKDLILSIESADSSFDEKLAAINKMEETLVAMRQQEEQAVQDNVDLIVEAIKLMEKKVSDQLEIAKSIVPEKGDKGDKGDRGADGKAGRDGLNGRDGKDGRDGVDGADGVSVTDAKIDFDGSLVITLSTGREINVGEVVAPDLAEKIKVITTMSTNGAVVIQDEGTTVSGGVKSINFVGASVTTTNSGDDVTVSVAGSVYDPTNVAITGGNINGTTIGGTTPAAGTFTTLTATGQTSLGGVAGSESVIFPTSLSSGGTVLYGHGGTASGTTGGRVYAGGSATDVPLNLASKGSGGSIKFFTNESSFSSTWSNRQLQVSHTASAVNYVQVTGAATTGYPVISAQGSDSNAGLILQTKGNGFVRVSTGGGPNSDQLRVNHTANPVNYAQITGAVTGAAPVFSVAGTDTNIDLTLTPKGTGQTNIGTNFANYFALSGAATTKTVEAKALGSDTNIAFTIDSKGTGAVNLAAGSSGVNISNGGTVTAITRTAAGSGYTSKPTVAITAPTTAGGVQATASVGFMYVSGYTVAAGGSGYTVGDVLTVVGGTQSGGAATLTVATVSAGAVTTVTVSNAAAYSVLPTNPVSITGGTGTGATFNLTWSVIGFNIDTAGSGYVEQPTVSFSGGGGSGAAAYATVGAGAVIRALGATGTQSLDFYTPQGITASVPAMRIRDLASDSYVMVNNQSGSTNLVAQGNANANFFIGANGSGTIRLTTSGTSLTEQMRVSHTASAVNYVQVTGAATTAPPAITVQGSDTNIRLNISSKGTESVDILTNNTGTRAAKFTYTASSVNWVQMTGAIAGSAPSYSVAGTDTNIDLTLTPKGTGVVQFGSYTASALLPVAGYITIKDSGGTTRRLLVG